jgi:hypothetical protein
MSTTGNDVRYEMVWRCKSEWDDCSWSTRHYDEIDGHEALFGHYVTGRMERVATGGSK